VCTARWPTRSSRSWSTAWSPGRPLRILLCSDVASEGLNLHYFCHRLVHFDLPWSLMVFQQRNGRVTAMARSISRIVYLFTDAANEKSRATCASWKSSNARTSRPP
jgi:hypothetical protein